MKRTVEEYYENGSIKNSYTYRGKCLHSYNDYPSMKCWNEKGVATMERYHKDGELHREAGPASFSWYPNGSMCLMLYVVDDAFHREDGPAYIKLNQDGSTQFEKYYLKGVELSEAEFMKRHAPVVEEVEADIKWLRDVNATPTRSVAELTETEAKVMLARMIEHMQVVVEVISDVMEFDADIP